MQHEPERSFRPERPVPYRCTVCFEPHINLAAALAHGFKTRHGEAKDDQKLSGE